MTSYDGTSEIITSRKPETLFNFGPASYRDSIVYTCERPGGDPEGDSKIPVSSVEEWIVFMKRQGIQRVMVLLDENELEVYEQPPGLLQLYRDHGLQVHMNPMGFVGSAQHAEQLLNDAVAAEEKIVAHCTHGMGRSGRVAAGWLVMKYGLPPQEASVEAIETAIQYGVERMGNPTKLQAWLDHC